MGLPARIERTLPADSDNPSAGAAQIRNLKGFLEDLFGVLDTQTYTAKAMDVALSGQVTVAQQRLLLQDGSATIPAFAFSGATGTGLRYDSVNDAIGLMVSGTQVARVGANAFSVNALKVISGGATNISTGSGSILMTTANGATNAVWIPIQHGETTFYVPGFATHAP